MFSLTSFLILLNSFVSGFAVDLNVAGTIYKFPPKFAVMYDGGNDGAVTLSGLQLALEDINNDPSLFLFHNMTFEIKNTQGDETYVLK